MTQPIRRLFWRVDFPLLLVERPHYGTPLVMKKVPVDTIFEYFGCMPDPLIDRTKDHKLLDIIVIAICAVICGADG